MPERSSRRSWSHEGAEAARRLRTDWPSLGLLLLSQAVESRYAAVLAWLDT